MNRPIIAHDDPPDYDDRFVTDYYSLRIELQGIVPLIWRRLMVPASIRLPKLHRAIQGAMGWSNRHLHEFNVAAQRYGEPDDEDFPDSGLVNEKGKTLSTLIGSNIGEFTYLYDFGDLWRHRIVVETLQPGRPYWFGSLCVAGERACPPEDVSGPNGYQRFLDALSDPQHRDHIRLLMWIGGIFDPAGFDINSANDRIVRRRGY